MIVQSQDQLRQVIEASRRNPIASVDLESTGLLPYQGDRLIGMAIRFMPEDLSFYLPFRHRVGACLDPSDLRYLAPWFANPAHTAVGHNLSGFDYHFLEADGVRVNCAMHDTLLMAHLNDENEPSRALKALAAKYVDKDAGAEEARLRDELVKRKLGKNQMDQLAPEVVAPYAEKDAELAWLLYGNLLKRLDAQGLSELTKETHEYAAALADIRRQGLLIDVVLCEQRHNGALNEATRVLGELVRDGLADHTFNPNSSKQVQRALGTPKADEATLEPLSREDTKAGRLAKGVLEYRNWNKVATSFYGPLLESADAYSILHPELNVTGTVTGRLSCTNPNMQALPRTSGATYRVRDAIIAPRGHTLVSLDYAQVEMRLATYYAQEQGMLSIFQKGADIHGETGRMAGIERQDAKAVNFGTIYGIGARALAENLSRASGKPRSESEAAAILSRYHAQFPGFRKLMRRAESQAKSRGYIALWTGRRRHYNEETETHKAMSNLIQGGVGEIVRVAMTRLHRVLRGTGARMILQVHDDILFYVPTSQVDEFVPMARGIMTDFVFGSVPIVCDAKAGPSWGALTEWHPSRLF